MQPDLTRRALAEFLATFTLVFAGCGAIVANDVADGAVGHVGIALTFGLALGVMVYATGHLSGAHLNPAVTLTFVATRHLPLRDAGAYIVAQLGGATAAALVLRAIYGNVANLGATVPNDLGASVSFPLELVMTAFLMFVILAMATDVRAVGQAAAIAIGGTLLLDALFGGAISGASMNPARSFGPALVSGTWDDFWVYVIGPIAGALVGGFAYQLVRGERLLAVPEPASDHRVAADEAPVGDIR